MKGSFGSRVVPLAHNRNFQPEYYQSNHAMHPMNIPMYYQPVVPNHPQMDYPYSMMSQPSAYMFQHQGQGYSNSTTKQPFIFQNPLQKEEVYNNSQNTKSSYSHPYPKGNYNPKPPQSGVSSIMNSFKSQDGSIDFNKMINTAGQMMNAVNQVSSMVKGFGGFFKA